MFIREWSGFLLLMVPPSLTQQINDYVPALLLATMVWVCLFGQEIFRGQFTRRSLAVLILMIAGAAACVVPPIH